jgi:hypothetical protein
VEIPQFYTAVQLLLIQQLVELVVQMPQVPVAHLETAMGLAQGGQAMVGVVLAVVQEVKDIPMAMLLILVKAALEY